MSTVTLSELYVYPVKSCRGVSLSSARVVRRGLEHDRRWMLVDPEGRFVTAREEHQLVTVEAHLEHQRIVLRASGRSSLELPLVLSGGPTRSVTVWRSTVEALEHPDGGRWFSELCGRPLSLVFMPDESERAVNPERGRAGDIVSFADGYPLLLIGEGSLADLNQRLSAPVDMRRFRPNLVVRGLPPFAEDELSTFSIGSVRFRAVKPCERCVMTTVDPDTGVAGKEPLSALAAYRRTDAGVLFGMNLIHDTAGELCVGDSLFFS